MAVEPVEPVEPVESVEPVEPVEPVELIRMTAAIRRYGLSRDTFDIATRDGYLKKYKLTRATFFDAREIDRWIMGKSHAA